MNINISDDKISEMIEKELRSSIRSRIETVMNNGRANWFTEFNIMNITRNCISEIVKDSVAIAFDDYINKLDYVQLSKDIGDVITARLISSVFDINMDGD